MSLTLVISEEQLQTAFDNHINKLMVDSYENPVKKIVDSMLGYSSTHPIKGELKTKVEQQIDALLQTEKFVTMVGEAFAKEIAKREADRIERNKR
jgi:hypothetical protein